MSIVEKPGLRKLPGKKRVLLGAAIATALLAACAAPQASTPTPGAAPFEISQATNQALQEYFALIDNTRRGAFAVSVDGNNSYSYYCPELSCQSNLFSGIATSQCESLSGQECLVLFVARDPRIAFSVSGDGGTSGRHSVRRGRPLDEMNAFK